MWAFGLLMLGACGLGLTHALEVDHMTAVSTFVAQKPSPRQAALFGLKWSIGHAISLLLLGSILFLLRLSISEGVAGSLERLVGVALFVLGLWTLVKLRGSFLGHTHEHAHTPQDLAGAKANGAELHPHTHADGTTHSHAHNSLWMGMLHGAAGTAAFIGQSLVAVTQNYVTVFAFTFAFSVGVLIAMTAYSAVLGGLLTLGERRSNLFIHTARAGTGVWACAVGLYWVFK
ncbi:MAG TPA: hypothetical protein VF681_14820 [Abditibacteriaceae bacterium]|jgi:ABC-type nickel/cobalt efflux system permease component RcnA